MKNYLILALLTVPFQGIANGSSDLAGSWEGFYSGSHVHQGKMTIEIGVNSCSITMQQLDKSEKLEFPCKNMSQSKGVYAFTAEQKFTAGAGQIEWHFTFVFGVGHANPKVTQKLIGTWLQGMKEGKSGHLIGLNSGSMKLKKLPGN